VRDEVQQLLDLGLEGMGGFVHGCVDAILNESSPSTQGCPSHDEREMGAGADFSRGASQQSLACQL